MSRHGLEGRETHGQLLADSVPFAIMRRISRESFYTARVIDLAARLIDSIIASLPDCRQVHVYDVDRLDRLSLKVLTRAVVLLEPAHKFSWIWHSASDPTASISEPAADLYVVSRQTLLRQLLGLTCPTVRRQGAPLSLSRPNVPLDKITAFDTSAAVVMQNYDACFLWSQALLRSREDEDVAEGYRLMALAAVNIGRGEDALQLLQRAEQLCGRPGRRAHLAYLQGLIEAKRLYDLSNSTAHYERGLSRLEGRANNGEDFALERGWLWNGVALNEAILWRRGSPAGEHFERAFALERDAFDLVREGDDPARFYLRFNLLANSAFLMEMQGHYDVAIDVLRQAFEFVVDRSANRQRRWQSTLG